MALARRLIELMGGQIWFESAAGQESVFHFTIRCDMSPEAAVPGAPAISGMENAKVLVIDDNDTSRAILEQMVRYWKMQPTSLAEGKAAVDLVTERHARGEAPFDLIISDVQMPKMDGFETVRAIKGLPAYWNVPTVMISSGDHRYDTERCREVGVQLYLRKPVFRPRLQARLSALLRKKPNLAGGSAGQVPLPPMKRLRVLIAEDNAVNQLVARKMLERAGHRVDCVSDGAQALAKYQSQPYDLILMDVQMPQMDGCEAARQIREVEKNQGGHICIIALTAHVMSSDRERCLRAGMDHHLAKPLKFYELYALLSQLFPVG